MIEESRLRGIRIDRKRKRTMGDKSPKSKQRNEKQKQTVKEEEAAKARVKHASFTFGGGAEPPKGGK